MKVGIQPRSTDKGHLNQCQLARGVHDSSLEVVIPQAESSHLNKTYPNTEDVSGCLTQGPAGPA